MRLSRLIARIRRPSATYNIPSASNAIPFGNESDAKSDAPPSPHVDDESPMLDEVHVLPSPTTTYKLTV
jgi:hypothetical protein